MLSLLFLTICAFASDLVPEAEPLTPEQVVTEQLAFVERNVLQIYSHGGFPEIFNVQASVVSKCGCDYTPTQIFWGSGVGMYCKIVRDAPTYEFCGRRCLTTKGHTVTQFCPDGFISDCTMGCVPPMFDNLEARIQFWDNQVSSIAEFGTDYVDISEDRLRVCGCEGQRVKHVEYGSNVGWECRITEPVIEEECGVAFRSCHDFTGAQVQIFCMHGFEPTCDGCKKVLELPAVDWMVTVISTYMSDAQESLGIKPRNDQVVECGCTDGAKRIDYGYRVGYYCHTKADVSDECLTYGGIHRNRLCKTEEGEYVMHFCPAGFAPSCKMGCAHWWKQEL